MSAAAYLLPKKALNLEDVPEIESVPLSTRRELEPINNSLSTCASTIKISVVLLASEGEATVSNCESSFAILH